VGAEPERYGFMLPGQPVRHGLIARKKPGHRSRPGRHGPFFLTGSRRLDIGLEPLENICDQNQSSLSGPVFQSKQFPHSCLVQGVAAESKNSLGGICDNFAILQTLHRLAEGK